MGTREEPFERQCPFCGRKNMRELVADSAPDDDDYIRKVFKCQNCGRTVWVSCPRPVYKPLEELKAKRWGLERKLYSAYEEFDRLWDSLNAENDVTKELKAVKAAIDDLWLKLEKLDDKINETRRMRESK